MSSKITSYEIIDHGVDHSQYFQGCGVMFTDFDLAVTGIGDNAKEAYEDAVDQLWTMDLDASRLPKRPRGIRKSDRVHHTRDEDEDSEVYYHVSIRVAVAQSSVIRSEGR